MTRVAVENRSSVEDVKNLEKVKIRQDSACLDKSSLWKCRIETSANAAAVRHRNSKVSIHRARHVLMSPVPMPGMEPNKLIENSSRTTTDIFRKILRQLNGITKRTDCGQRTGC